MRRFLRNIITALAAIAALASCSDEPFMPVGMMNDLRFALVAGDVTEGQDVPFTVTLEEGEPSAKYTIEVTLDGTALGTIGGPGGNLALPYAFTFPSDLSAGFALPALAPGTHTLTVTITSGGAVYTQTITFTVYGKEDPTVHVSEVRVPQEDVVLYVGETKEVEIYALPLNAADRNVSVVIGDGSVVSLSQVQTGSVLWKLTGLKVGTTTVTCSADGREASFKVIVLAKEVNAVSGPDEVTLKVGDSQTLYYTASPEDAADRTLSAEMMNTSVATVKANSVDNGAFVVTGVKVGTTSLVVSAKNGVSKTTAVKVVEKTAEDIKVIDPASGSTGISGIGDITMKEGDVRSMSFVLYPDGVSDQSVTVTVSDPSVVGVSGSGLDWTFTGLKEGRATVTVRNGNVEKKFVITVTAPDLKALNAPESLTVTEGSSVEFTVTRVPQNAATGDMKCSSDNSSVATVTALGNGKFKVTGVKAGTTRVKVWEGGVSAYVNITVNAKEDPVVPVTSVKTSPASLSLVEGETGSFTVTVTPDNATDAGNVSVKSSDEGVATVKYEGGKYVVTALSEGSATITVSCGGKTATVTVTVKAKTVDVTGVHVPGDLSMTEGDTRDVDIYVTPDNATDKSLTVTSSSTSVAKVEKRSGDSYRITAVSEGTATITAKAANGRSATFRVTVSRGYIDVTSVKVSPTSLSIEEGSTGTFTVSVSPSDATDAGNISVSSGNTSVATVKHSSGNKYTVTGVNAGSTTIKVTCGGKTANVSVTVTKKDVITYQSYLVVTLSPSSIEVGDKATATVKKYTDTYTNGQLTSQDTKGTSVSNGDCSWSSSKSSVATVSNGTVTGVAQGTATITAKLKSDSFVTGTAEITVKKPDDVITHELKVSPSSAELSEGESVTFKATYYTITNGSKDSGTDVTSSASWSVKSGTSYVTSNGKGKFSWKGGAGSATIQASYSGETATASISTKAHVPVETTGHELELSGSDVSVEVGKTVSVSRSAKYYTITYLDGKESGRTSQTVNATLSSGNTGVATVSGTTVTGKGEGTAYLSGTYNGTESSNSIKVTVTAHVPVVTTEYELELTGKDVTVEEGGTVSVSRSAKYYTVTYSDGVETDRTYQTVNATLSSDNTGVATVSGTTVTGKSKGTAHLKGSYNGKTSKNSITVTVTEYEPTITYELELTPGSATLDEGESVSFKAMYYTLTDGVRDGGQNVTTSASWSISSGSSYISSTSTKGKYTWKDGAGNATVKATYSGKSATASVSTNAHEEVITYELDVTPARAELDEGESVSFKAMYYKLTDGVRDSGQNVTTSASWSISSGDSYISSTSTKGKYTWKSGPGSAVVKATYSGKSATAAVVTRAHEEVITYELEVTPGTSTIGEGETASLTATYYTLTDGVRNGGQDVTASATWTVTAGTSYVTSSGKGKFAWKSGAGTATVKATYSGKSDTAEIRTKAHEEVVTYELVVSPSSPVLAEGESVSLTATYYTITDGVRNSGQNVTSSATWSVTSGSGYVSSTSTKGKYTWKAGAGQATVKATYNGESDTATITTKAHEAVITSSNKLVLTGSDVSVKKGSTATVSRSAKWYTYTYTDGQLTDTDETTVNATLYSNSTSIATVSGTTVTGVKAGSTTLYGKYNGVSSDNTIGVTVTEDVITHELVVTPGSASVTVGGGQQFTATYYTTTNGSRDGGQNVTSSASWSSSKTSVATVSAGYATGKGEGSATITASYNGCSDSGSLTVTKPAEPELQTISVSPTSLNLDYAHGWDAKITVTGHYSDGSTRDVTSNCLFENTNGIVSIDSQGNVHALKPGSCNVMISNWGVAYLSINAPLEYWWEGINPYIEADGNYATFSLAASVMNHYDNDTYEDPLNPGTDYTYTVSNGITVIKQNGYLELFINKDGYIEVSATSPVSGEKFTERISLYHH